jgi:hypothetical protein
MDGRKHCIVVREREAKKGTQLHSHGSEWQWQWQRQRQRLTRSVLHFTPSRHAIITRSMRLCTFHPREVRSDRMSGGGHTSNKREGGRGMRIRTSNATIVQAKYSTVGSH